MSDNLVPKIKELIEAGYSRSIIAQMLGTTKGVVSGIAHRHGLKKPTNVEHKNNCIKYWSEEEEQELIRLYKAGCAISSLAKRFHRSRSAIEFKLKGLGVKQNGWQRRRTIKKKAAIKKNTRLIQLPEPSTELAVKLIEAQGDQCRWPISDPSADMMVCGAKVSSGAYCAFHNRKKTKSREEIEQDREMARKFQRWRIRF